MIKLSELFKISYGTKLDFNKMDNIHQSNINFVSRSSKNLGVIDKVKQIDGVEPLKAGIITVTLGGTYVLSAFVQPEPFYTAQNVAVLEPITEMANRTFKELTVPELLEIPKWVYTTQLPTINNSPIISKKIEFEADEWVKYKYSDLFEIKRGNIPSVKKYSSGNTPFISATSFNNGASNYIDAVPMFKGNCISVSGDGSIAEAFYQKKPFCANTAVNILIPKFNLNNYSALFICTVIRLEKFRFNYGYKWGMARLKNSEIKLPTRNEKLDTEYMENYIKTLPFSSSI
jgi:hypothetical protein